MIEVVYSCDKRDLPMLLGKIPYWLNENDPRPAREQLDANYQHGGGWMPFEGFKLSKNMTLTYPGDPPMQPFAFMLLREEKIVFYPHAWVLILQPDGTFEICRMD